MSTEEMLAFHEAHGLAALLDHLGLDGLGNEVVELRAENQRLRDAIGRVLCLTSTYDQETYGRTVHLVNNLQARQMLTDALSATAQRENP